MGSIVRQSSDLEVMLGTYPCSSIIQKGDKHPLSLTYVAVFDRQV